MGVFDGCWEVFRPQPDEPWLLWAHRHLKTFDGGSERAWDHFASPHVGAPGGPAEAYEDPTVREIALMWASRLAKTTCCLGFMLWTSHVSPSPAMLTNATRDLVQDTVSERAWRMADAAGVFGRLPREGKRSKRKVRLPGCRWNTGWAENARTLADKTAKILHCGEVDKWRWLKGTNEADPFQLAKERAKEWPDRKLLIESTPTIAKRSRVEGAFLGGWGCHYFVPCPRCKKYQRLNLGGGGPGGIVYQKDPGARRDPMLAYRTARYVCLHCEAAIGEEARPWMMRRGVWVPTGCDVDHDGAAALFEGVPDGVTHLREDLPTEQRPYRWRGWAHAPWIRGGPSRPGDAASYQLSTIYSLSVGWNVVAKEFVECLGRVGGLQNFVNSWLGETWREEKQTEEWESLVKRLTWLVPRRLVPREASMVTVGIDRQKAHFVVDTIATAPGRRPAVIDYGYVDSLDEVRAWLLQTFPHTDGGGEVPICQALIDVNYHPSDEAGATIHEWIRETNRQAAAAGSPLRVAACRGANRALGAPYRVRKMGADSHCPGARLVEVCPDHSHDWVEKLLFGEPTPGGELPLKEPTAAEPEAVRGPPRLHLYQAEPNEHEDWMKQVLNEQPIERVNKQTKSVRRMWGRIDENIPNDHRDAVRYALAALLLATRNGPVPSRALQVAVESGATTVRRPPTNSFMTPDGRPFFLLNRR